MGPVGGRANGWVGLRFGTAEGDAAAGDAENRTFVGHCHPKMADKAAPMAHIIVREHSVRNRA